MDMASCSFDLRNVTMPAALIADIEAYVFVVLDAYLYHLS